MSWGRHRVTAFVYFVILLGVAALNYLPIPGIVDAEGRSFGIFALDPGDDLLHLASALWALAGAVLGVRAARVFLIGFGALYLADGLMGLAIGSGYLDGGLWRWGVQDLPFAFKVFANAPHIGLGGVALAVGLSRP